MSSEADADAGPPVKGEGFVINPMSEDAGDAAASPQGEAAQPVGVSAANHLWVPQPLHATIRTLIANHVSETAVIGVIICNTALMMVYHPNNPVMLNTKGCPDDDPCLPEYERTKSFLDFIDFVFTLFYTSECLLRIAGFGFFQDGLDSQKNRSPTITYDSYWSSSWNRLDLFVVTTAWVTNFLQAVFGYDGIGKKTAMLRALRVLRIMHAFRFLSGIRAIMHSLGRAGEGMGNICLMFIFFFCVYSIIGMAVFQGSLRTQCVTQEVADLCECCSDGKLTVNGTDGCLTGALAPCAEFDKSNALIWGGVPCDQLWAGPGDDPRSEPRPVCPASIECSAPDVCMVVGFNSRGGMAGYDNIASSFLSLFIATTGDNWQDITWVFKWSPTTTAPLAYPFFVSIQFLLTMTAMNIFVAVICGAFDEVRAEHHSAFAEDSDEEAAAEDEPAEEAADEGGEDATADSGEGAEEEDEQGEQWAIPRPEGWTKPSYQSDDVERLTENPLFEHVSTGLIMANVVTLSMNHHGMSPALYLAIEYIDVVFTLVFDVEMILKIVGLGFKRYWTVAFNRMDTLVNITCTIALVFFFAGIEGEGMGLIKVFRLTRVLRVMRLLGKIDMVRELLEVVMGSWVAVINLCVFILYCLFVFSLFGMHMMGDLAQFDDQSTFLDEGTGDPSAVPRPTFDTFLMAFSTCFLMMTGDRWKVTMYTYMQTYGLAAAPFFMGLWMLCSCVLMNLFVAVVVENFSLAEDEMLERQKLKYKKQNSAPVVTNAMRRLGFKIGLQGTIEKIEESVGDEGKSYFIFGPENPVRKACKVISESHAFEVVILLMIVGNSCMIAYEGPPGTLDRETMNLMLLVDHALLLGFWCEFLVRTIAMGFLFTKEAYISSPWNKMDFFIIVTALLAYLFSGSEIMAEAANIFRLFRLLRPLRLLNKIEGMRHIIEALISSAGGLLGVALLGGVFYMMFAILGVNLFGGKFYKCDNLEVFGRHDCVGTYTYEAECPEPHSYPNDGKKCVYMGAPSWRIAYGGGPGDHGFSFDDISSALQTLFLVGTCAGWSECLYLSMDTVGVDMQPQRLANPFAAVYFICFLFVCSFALINLFVGVLIYLFGLSSGTSLQTEAQQRWALMKSVVASVDQFEVDEISAPAREGGIRIKAWNLIKKPWFDQVITGTILFNVVVMMANYYPEPQGWSTTLEVLNYLCLLVFTLEMAAKLLGLGPAGYIKNPWNRIDSFVVVSSYFFITLEFIGLGSPALGQIARCLRVARIVLLVKRAKGLQQIFQLFFISIPAACNVLMLLLLVFFIYACLGMYLFGHLKVLPGFGAAPDGRGVRAFCPDSERALLGEAGNTQCGFGNYDNRGNFQNFPNAVMLLFQIASGEDFLFIVPELRLAPPFCTMPWVDDDQLDMTTAEWLQFHDLPVGLAPDLERAVRDIGPENGHLGGAAIGDDVTVRDMFAADVGVGDLNKFGVPLAYQEELVDTLITDEYGNCGNSFAFAFVASFYLLAAWLLLNMVIGVIMENYENIKAAEKLELTDEDVQNFMDEWTFQTQTGDGQAVGKMPTSRMRKFLAALPAEFVEQPFGAKQYAEVLHVLERQYNMSFEEQLAGYTVTQLMKVLMIIKAGGHLAMSIEEQIEQEQQSEADLNAKIVVGTIRSWVKVQREPRMKDLARVALTFRMKQVTKRRLVEDGESIATSLDET